MVYDYGVFVEARGEATGERAGIPIVHIAYIGLSYEERD